MMKVSPADLRFTQDSIACHFRKPYEQFSIREAVKKVQSGEMSPNDFPRLRVISYEGRLWSTDNRRLWAYRTAKCPQITVEMMNRTHYRLDELISIPARYRTFCKAEFLPRIRGTQNGSPMLTLDHQGLRPREGELLNRCAFRGSIQGGQHVLPPPIVASQIRPRGVEGAMTGSKWPTLHVSHARNSLVTTDGSVPKGPQLQSSNAKARIEPFSSSFSEASAVGHNRAVTKLPQGKLRSVDVVRSFGSYNRFAKETFARTPLLPASTRDRRRRSTNSWFGRVRILIFGCFGCA